MDEIIAGVQVIKFYAWEESFAKLIALARRSELKVVLKNAYVRALYMTFNIFTTRMAMFCTVLSIILMYGRENISVSKIFMISYMFGAISHAMCQTFVRGVAELAETLVAFKRLQMFLEYEEKHIEIDDNSIGSEQLKSRNLVVLLKNVSAGWMHTNNNETKKKKISKKVGSYKAGEQRNASETQSITLHEIDIEITKGKLIGIIGEVGSGRIIHTNSILHT